MRSRLLLHRPRREQVNGRQSHARASWTLQAVGRWGGWAGCRTWSPGAPTFQACYGGNGASIVCCTGEQMPVWTQRLVKSRYVLVSGIVCSRKRHQRPMDEKSATTRRRRVSPQIMWSVHPDRQTQVHLISDGICECDAVTLSLQFPRLFGGRLSFLQPFRPGNGFGPPVRSLVFAAISSHLHSFEYLYDPP